VALDRIEIQHLPERLDVGAMPSELEPAARKADALIRRVDEALERERRTTADIAHELRTPISELLAVSEVALRDRGDADSATRALATVRRVAWRMGRSVSTILKLARLEMGAEICAADSVDLGGTVRELLRTLMPFKRERALEIDNQVDSGVLVECDRDVLRIIVSNLLGNALYYAPRGSSVTCRLERAPEAWCFTVENEAGDLRREDLPTLSEPFWRKDSARTDHERSGLGLALSRALAAKTGMELRFELEAGKFRASLVRASPASVDTRVGSRSA
jgi:signal transduction histidine kinase